MVQRFMPYLQRHRPDNQTLVDDIPVDPLLPDHFYTASAEERDPQEISDWMGRPYIIKFSWADREANYREFRAKGMPPEYEEGYYDEDWWPATGSDAWFEEELLAFKGRWYESFPDGIRYEIHCMGGRLEGDQATISRWGGCASLADAVLVAKAGDARFKFPDILHRLVQHREHREGFE